MRLTQVSLEMTTNQVEHIGLSQLSFEVRRSSEDESSHIWLVVCDETLHSHFGHFPHVVVTFLHSKTRKSKSGLTTASFKQIKPIWVTHLRCSFKKP